MNRAEFDKFADEYRTLHQSNIAASGENPEYFAEYKIKDLKRLADHDARRSEGVRILDFGAGIGTSVPFIHRYFADAELTCVDVSVKSLEIGASRFGGATKFIAFDGAHLPFPDGSFDYAFAACVFHHIPPEEHLPLLIEMRRVLKPRGQVMVYEHNPLNPLTVRAVNTCRFDENAILINARSLSTKVVAAGFLNTRIKYRVFFPRSLRWLRSLEARLGWLPLGAQYYVCGRR